jgi:hypothetical protein
VKENMIIISSPAQNPSLLVGDQHMVGVFYTFYSDWSILSIKEPLSTKEAILSLLRAYLE